MPSPGELNDGTLRLVLFSEQSQLEGRPGFAIGIAASRPKNALGASVGCSSQSCVVPRNFHQGWRCGELYSQTHCVPGHLKLEIVVEEFEEDQRPFSFPCTILLSRCVGQYMIGYYAGKLVKVQQMVGVDQASLCHM